MTHHHHHHHRSAAHRRHPWRIELGTPARPPRLRARLAKVALAVLTVGGAVGVAAPTSHAMIIGPTPVYGGPMNVSGEIWCGNAGQIHISASTSVQANYVNGQHVRWQYYLENNRGYRAYSGWSGFQFIGFNNYGQTGLATAYLTGQLATSWDAQVRVAYWNGSGYTYSQWFRVPKLQQGYTQYRTYCQT